jgi:hypothetical protein
MRFNNFLQQEQTNSLLEFIILMDISKDINESIVSDIKSKLTNVLKSTGLHLKQGKGLIHHLINAEEHVAKLIYHAFMAYYKHPFEQQPHKEELKKHVKKVNKEDIIDFFLKLDQLTMHLITGPLHMIDALTGTHLWANVADAVKPVKEKARSAIRSLEELKHELEGKLKTQVQKYSNGLRRVFGVGNTKKVTESTVGADISGNNGETNPDILIGDICPITGKKRKNCKCSDCMMRRKQGLL